ncbi:MAG TPA: alpha/beta hydrolase [Usitatibacteraceae bacterium]|nr:alpha/beta hydrolase [Usitatibacteraceae bacterium]
MNFIVQGYPAYAYTGGRTFDPKLPAVVFVHGAALDHSVWQWQSRHLANHGFSVLAVDLPGHGRSPGTLRTSVEALADWVAAFIEAACVDQAHVVGHSMGSLVALDTALRHPQRVAKLVLLGASVPMPVGEAFLAAAKDDSPAAFDMQTVWGHARLSALAASPVPGASLAMAGRWLTARSHAGVQHADLAACNAYAPAKDALRELKVPTLVIAGKRDQMTPLRAGQALAKEIPGARFLAFDAGHSLPTEAPREIAHALRAALA